MRSGDGQWWRGVVFLITVGGSEELIVQSLDFGRYV